MKANAMRVTMPLGACTSCEVSAPCGLCSTEGMIELDVPDTFLDPDRMRAGLIWFTRGYLEYQFPNNARLAQHKVALNGVSLELSSEVPGTSADWPSDITISVDGRRLAPGPPPAVSATSAASTRRTVAVGEAEGAAGTGRLKGFRVNDSGTFVDGMKISPVSLKDLDLETHHSIRLR